MSSAKKIRFFSTLTLVVFLMNVLLPSFAIYTIPESNAGDSPQTSLFSKRVLICTKNGFRWVLLEDLQNDKQQPKPHKKYRCALCYIAAQGSTDAISIQAIIFAHQHFQYIPFSITDANLISWLSLLEIKTRAPPYPA